MECNVISIFCTLYFTLFVHSTGVDSETSKVSFIPSNYFLHIKTTEAHFEDVDSSKMVFEGEVTVEFDMKKPENFNDDFKIMLNANSKMEIQTVDLEGKVFENYEKITSCKHSLEKDKLFINCTKDVQYTVFKLKVLYKSPFGKDMLGFYRSSYKDSSGKTRWLLSTHFEPIFARDAFPCFDSPDLRAKFTIQMTVPKNIKTVLSNTNRVNVTEGDTFATYLFKQTEIPMSPYLVAFSASNFVSTDPSEFESEYLENKFSKKRELRTYGRSDIIAEGYGKFAQEVGIEALNELTKYLKIGYAFEKVDQVGIPDFPAEAMENWGHICFREKTLFVNEKTTAIAAKQFTVLTVTHELVHQWFGNLVTLKSLDYIWLKEGFANFLHYKMASNFKISKSWNLMKQHLVNEVHLRAFESDGWNSSFPLNNKITDESYILPAFNDIPYAKGSSVLRMWDFEFKDAFQRSLQEFLKERKESSAEPSHLFEAFKKEAKMNEDTFKSWTDQAGYPVVEVKKQKNSYYLTQSRFFWDKMNSNEVWRIPITYSTDRSKEFQTVPSKWLHKEPLKIDLEEKCKWIIINNQQAGYYRVNYDIENWNALSKALSAKNHSDIHEFNRAQIVNDVFSLARSLQKNYVDYTTALSLTNYLKNDNSYIVWKTALNAFNFLQTKVHKEKIYDKFKAYILSLIKPHFKGLNSTASDHLEKLKNIEISRWACSLDFEPCVKEAKALFSDSSYQNFPDTQEIVLCTVIRNDQKVWDLVFDKYKNEVNGVLKVMYISALGCTKNTTQAEVFLNKIIEPKSDIRKQDLSLVLSSVYNGNLKNVEATFQFIKKNYKKFAAEYGDMNTLGKVLVGMASKLTTKEEVKNLESLVEEIKSSAVGKAAEANLESAKKIARSNNVWLEGKMVQFRDYFSSGSFVSYSFALLFLCLIAVFQF